MKAFNRTEQNRTEQKYKCLSIILSVLLIFSLFLNIRFYFANGFVNNIHSVDIRYLVVGNSISFHSKCSYWWGEWGMAASRKELDYVHSFDKFLKTKYRSVDGDVFNFSQWEIQGNDRYETLVLLDKYLSLKPNLIVIQLGENIMNFKTFDSDFSELINYITSKTSNSQIIILGNFWENSKIDKIKQKVAIENRCTYISLDSIQGNKDYFWRIGECVYGDDNKLHKIMHDGVAHHPNDRAMKFIADKIIEEI